MPETHWSSDDGGRRRSSGRCVEFFGAEVLRGTFVAPVAESAFGELHDVALVDEGHAVFVVVNGVLDGGLH